MPKKTYKHANKSNSKYKNKYYSKYNPSDSRTSIWILLPIILSMSLVPFITKLKEYPTNLSKFSWYTINDMNTDFFLYYKQSFFIILTAAMACIIVFKVLEDKKFLYFPRILTPLAVYAVLAIFSSLVSSYRKYSFTGSHDHFESIFTLLGYCLLVYYIILFVQTEKDVELIINCFVVSIIVMGLLGLTQFLGKDFFTTNFGLKLILTDKYRQHLDAINFMFENDRVYLTLHNPNYVGSYVALTVPFLIIIAALIRKNFWKLSIYILALFGAIISLIGSKSKTAIVSILAAGVLAIILLSRYILKYFYFTIPLILAVILSIVLYNKANDYILTEQLKRVYNFQKTEPDLQSIDTLDDEVVITYQGNQMHIKFIAVEGFGYFEITDSSNNNIPTEIIEGYFSYTIKDDRFPGFEVGLSNFEEKPCFYVNINGTDWFFTNQTEDGSYHYINLYGRTDKIVEAPSAVFTGYERYASGRGYIWSRTLPLLKKHIVLGSGADTFVLVFPMQDYVNRSNYGFIDQIITKPHNIYLQIGVQTGVVSLIAYLVFYIIYFISSFRLYIKGRFKSYYSQIGVAILISTFSYMVVGIANDSIIAVAPIYWALMGLGIVVNNKAKPLIEEEIANEKATKNKPLDRKC